MGMSGRAPPFRRAGLRALALRGHGPTARGTLLPSLAILTEDVWFSLLHFHHARFVLPAGPRQRNPALSI